MERINVVRCSVVSLVLLLPLLLVVNEAAPVFDGQNEAAVTPSGRCTECPAGEGVTRACHHRHHHSPATNGTASHEQHHEQLELDTQCEPCSAGVTFSDAPSRHAPCRACRVCPANSRVKRECDAAHDTECECERDYYAEITYPTTTTTTTTTTPGNETAADETPAADQPPQALHARHKHGASHLVPVLTCRACDLCPHGFGAARACSAVHNTVCRKCPTSTYSSVLSASLGCSVCTVCRDDQVTLHECTPIQDTVCADKDMGHPSRRVITKQLDQLVQQQQHHHHQQQQQHDDEYNNEGIISVYCAILGAIVLGLLVYVVMKQWRLRKAANKLAHYEPRHHGGCSASVPLNGNSPHMVATHPTIVSSQKLADCQISPSGSRRLGESDGSRGSRGSDSEFNAGLCAAPGSDGCAREPKPITQETRLRDICTAKRREMEAMLNVRRDHHDWKALARDLGYTSTRIASFEQKSIEKQTGPTRHLFADWAKREDSTVKNLVASLCNIGRHDVTLVLVPFIQEASTVAQSGVAAPVRSTLPRTATRGSGGYKPISVV